MKTIKLSFTVLLSLLVYQVSICQINTDWTTTATSTGLGTTSPSSLTRLDVVNSLTTSGDRFGIQSKASSTNYSFRGETLTRLNMIKSYTGDGHGASVAGYIYGVTKLSTSNGKDAFVNAGRFYVTCDDPDISQSGSGKVDIIGVKGSINGTLTSYPTNGVVSAVFGEDNIGGADSYAGYFEGKVGVTSTLYAEKVEVKLQEDWPDFVFYKPLRPLKEVSTYIQQNGHLPDIPTAKEVKVKGIDLGKMNAKLLQKIEELTLYTIEQQKAIESLMKEVEKQNTIIEELKKAINLN